MLIASPLEPHLVDRIIASDERARVVYEPELLPIPQYPGDHHGVHRQLDQVGLMHWRSLLAGADILFDFDWLDPARLPQLAPRVRWVQATSSGIGEFLADTGLDRSDIVFTTAAGIHATPLAEFALLGLLYVTKDVPRLRASQQIRKWERHTSDELAGRRVLIIGLGRVGTRIAHVCSSAGLEVWGIRRTVMPVDGVERVFPVEELHEALPHVDAVILSCPNTPETHHLIGARELKLLPPHAAIVNLARGSVIDERALIESLKLGSIKGAVLDVFETEPLPADSPLWEMPNVLISPHSASTVWVENERIVDIFLENLSRYLDGRPLVNRFDPKRGY